jgi:Domain of unknown function (DUF4142)
MVSDHKEDVAAFRRESSNGQDADVKEFATQTLPTLEDHLKEAQNDHSKIAAIGGQRLASRRSSTELIRAQLEELSSRSWM